MNNEAKCAVDCKPRKWYNNQIFPLVPQLKTREADDHNTYNWSFHWLFFKVWTRDSAGLELAFVCDTHWGIGFTAMLPYLRLVATIPAPFKLQMWSQKHLWRKPIGIPYKK